MSQTAVLVVVGLLTTSMVAAQAPPGWRGGPGWDVGLDREVRHGGRASGFIAVGDVDAAGGFGTLRQSFLSDEFRGQRVSFSAWVKTGPVQEGAALWMRVDGDPAETVAFDNMSDRLIAGETDWRRFAIVLDVPQKATSITFGMMVIGKGRAWIDDIRVETVGADTPATGLSAAQLAEMAKHAAADHGHSPEEAAKARQEAAERLRTLPKRPVNLDFEG